MSGIDNAKKTERLRGKAKEAGGEVTGHMGTVHERKADQAPSDFRDAG